MPLAMKRGAQWLTAALTRLSAMRASIAHGCISVIQRRTCPLTRACPVGQAQSANDCDPAVAPGEWVGARRPKAGLRCGAKDLRWRDVRSWQQAPARLARNG